MIMEPMNGECQEAIICAFMNMHPDEIQLTKEQVNVPVTIYISFSVNRLNALETYALISRTKRLRVILQVKRIIHLEVQSKPMYLRTLLYALRQGVALDHRESGISIQPTGVGYNGLETLQAKAKTRSSRGEVPDYLLDLYLSSGDSISLTSKVLDIYAVYVDEGEVSIVRDLVHVSATLLVSCVSRLYARSF